jgi:hypothetical protein
MRIEDFFCSPDQQAQGLFIVVDEVGRGASAPDRWHAALAALPPRGYLAVAVLLEGCGKVARMASLLGLRRRLKAAERSLVRCGTVPVGRYGVAPELGSATFVYPLKGAACRYADAHLLPGTGRGPLALLKRVMRLIARCDPSLGAVLVIGRKP